MKLKTQTSEPKKSSPGTFRDDGSFWQGAEHQSHFHHELIDLGKRLKRENITPKYAADLVTNLSGHVESDAVLENWRKHDRVELWPLTHTSTSAGEFLKRCAVRS